MAYPNPYFKDVSGIGNLSIRFIIFETKYPVLFVCTDIADNLYLCVCCDIRYTQRWIIAPVDKDIIRNLLTDQITIRDAFIGYYIDKPRCLIEYSFTTNQNNERVGNLQSKTVSIDEIPEEDLPKAGEIMEVEDDEFADILSEL